MTSGGRGVLDEILVGLALALLYVANRRRYRERGEHDRPPPTAEERRLQTRAMWGVLLGVVTLLLGVMPGLVAVIFLEGGDSRDGDRIFSIIVLGLGALGVCAGWAITRNARKGLDRLGQDRERGSGGADE